MSRQDGAFEDDLEVEEIEPSIVVERAALARSIAQYTHRLLRAMIHSFVARSTYIGFVMVSSSISNNAPAPPPLSRVFLRASCYCP